jgi:hypothetical protein
MLVALAISHVLMQAALTLLLLLLPVACQGFNGIYSKKNIFKSYQFAQWKPEYP